MQHKQASALLVPTLEPNEHHDLDEAPTRPHEGPGTRLKRCSSNACHLLPLSTLRRPIRRPFCASARLEPHLATACSPLSLAAAVGFGRVRWALDRERFTLVEARHQQQAGGAGALSPPKLCLGRPSHLVLRPVVKCQIVLCSIPIVDAPHLIRRNTTAIGHLLRFAGSVQLLTGGMHDSSLDPDLSVVSS